MKNHNNFNSNGNGKHGVGLPQQNTSHAFHEYLAILYSGRWIIITSFLVVMSSVVYWTFTTPPTYEASTTIIIDEKKEGYGQSLFAVGGITQQITMINNQVEILKSRSLVKEVLERLLQTPM